MTDEKGGLAFSVRTAQAGDMELLWRWANDPTVRVNSFNTDSIPFESHVAWYTSKLNSPDTSFWILEEAGTPIAQIRYDRVDPQTAEISFSVDHRHRGKGAGTVIVTRTRRQACRILKVTQLRAFVLVGNPASKQIFTKSGFTWVRQQIIKNRDWDLFVWRCDLENESISS